MSTNSSQNFYDDLSKVENNIYWFFGTDNFPILDIIGKYSKSFSISKKLNLGSHLNVLTWGNGNISNFFDYSQIKGRGKPKYDYFLHKGFSKTWEFYLRKLILNRLDAQFSNQKIFVDEFRGSIASKIISKCLPNSKIIMITQDGRDFITNQLRLFRNEKISPMSFPVWVSPDHEISVIEYWAKQWTHTSSVLLDMLNQHDSQLTLHVKFEDLCTNLNSSENLLNFLSLEYTREEILMLQKQLLESSKTSLDWKKYLKDDELTSINNIMNDVLLKLNY